VAAGKAGRHGLSLGSRECAVFSKVSHEQSKKKRGTKESECLWASGSELSWMAATWGIG
jgi:hypothetical protein